MKCLAQKEWLNPLENLSHTHVSIDFIGFETCSQTFWEKNLPKTSFT